MYKYFWDKFLEVEIPRSKGTNKFKQLPSTQDVTNLGDVIFLIYYNTITVTIRPIQSFWSKQEYK